MAEAIRIDGLAEFSRALRKMDSDLPKGLRVALNDAVNVVIDAALPNVPRRTGRAAATLKAKSTRNLARASGGSARAPYYPWLDFGGRVGRRKATKRAFLKDGRYLYPAYFSNRDEFERVMTKAIVDLARGAGLAVD